jgi:hypothetical protein
MPDLKLLATAKTRFENNRYFLNDLATNNPNPENPEEEPTSEQASHCDIARNDFLTNLDNFIETAKHTANEKEYLDLQLLIEKTSFLYDPSKNFRPKFQEFHMLATQHVQRILATFAEGQDKLPSSMLNNAASPLSNILGIYFELVKYREALDKRARKLDDAISAAGEDIYKKLVNQFNNMLYAGPLTRNLDTLATNQMDMINPSGFYDLHKNNQPTNTNCGLKDISEVATITPETTSVKGYGFLSRVSTMLPGAGKVTGFESTRKHPFSDKAWNFLALGIPFALEDEITGFDPVVYRQLYVDIPKFTNFINTIDTVKDPEDKQRLIDDLKTTAAKLPGHAAPKLGLGKYIVPAITILMAVLVITGIITFGILPAALAGLAVIGAIASVIFSGVSIIGKIAKSIRNAFNHGLARAVNKLANAGKTIPDSTITNEKLKNVVQHLDKDKKYEYAIKDTDTLQIYLHSTSSGKMTLLLTKNEITLGSFSGPMDKEKAREYLLIAREMQIPPNFSLFKVKNEEEKKAIHTMVEKEFNDLKPTKS